MLCTEAGLATLNAGLTGLVGRGGSIGERIMAWRGDGLPSGACPADAGDAVCSVLCIGERKYCACVAAGDRSMP